MSVMLSKFGQSLCDHHVKIEEETKKQNKLIIAIRWGGCRSGQDEWKNKRAKNRYLLPAVTDKCTSRSRSDGLM